MARSPAIRVRADRAHPWDVPPAEATEIQHRLAGLVSLRADAGPLVRIAGCDVSYDAELDRFFAAVLVLRLPDLVELERAEASGAIPYPYIPGLLSFREAPVLLRALEQLSEPPDALMLDGQGIAHPRRLGLASHIGVLLDLPTVGCAKSVLVGRFEEPGEEAGQWSPMIHRGETVGAALRTRPGTRPVYVSPGHRMDLDGSVRLVLACTDRYKLPEPTRRADRCVAALRARFRQELEGSGG